MSLPASLQLDAPAAERRAVRIRLRLDSIADNYTAVLPMIREAIEQRDDLALGYRSVGEYVADRFGGALTHLGIDVRREVVRELTSAGMSTRAIAPVVGISDRQVRYDVERVGSGFPPPAVDPTTGEVADDYPEPTTAAPAPVTGIDGKTYTRPAPRAPTPDELARQAERDAQAFAEDRVASCAMMLGRLSDFRNPDYRRRMREAWQVGSLGAPPTTRPLHDPATLRELGHLLITYAEECEHDDA